jgi:hypothetical protein
MALAALLPELAGPAGSRTEDQASIDTSRIRTADRSYGADGSSIPSLEENSSCGFVGSSRGWCEPRRECQEIWLVGEGAMRGT